MYVESQIKRIKHIIDAYKYEQPFSIYLKQFFRSHPEMGSTDRRITREWSFNLLRIGINLDEDAFELRLCIANFLCSKNSNQSLDFLFDKYSAFKSEETELSLEEKLFIVKKYYPLFKMDNIFQMHEYLNPSIKKNEWYLSFLKKPRVWIRIKNGKREEVINELRKLNIDFVEEDDQRALSFEPEVSLDKTESFQKSFFQIQDINSQRTRNFLQPKKGEKWWDACAASGGKSLLLIDEQPEIEIYATDIRNSILTSYQDRLSNSGFRNFKTAVVDLNSPVKAHEIFDGIITDVPCTGSGTWSRSPEWLYKDMRSLLFEYYVERQRTIITNSLPALKTGSPLIYITCSAFSAENEENVRYFLNHLPLKLEKSAYLEGYENGSDTLYIARFLKSF
jgi:16S rRNA (cytosine967-C5)-methyltransferase